MRCSPPSAEFLISRFLDEGNGARVNGPVHPADEYIFIFQGKKNIFPPEKQIVFQRLKRWYPNSDRIVIGDYRKTPVTLQRSSLGRSPGKGPIPA
jgi:hypothetical protein